jgi:heterodisulfide reductase subunit B
MAKYGLFVGCIAPLRYPGIESSTREILKALGVDFGELPGASCCPAPGVMRSFSQDTWLAIGARNLAIAEKHGMDIITICNGCFGSLFDVAHILHENPKKLEEVNKVLKEVGLHYSGHTKVRHFAEFFYRDIGLDKLKTHIKNPQSGISAAVHYGCHFLKPSNIKGLDDPERPKMLDELVEITGAKSVPYKDKNMCCGAGGGVRARAPDTAMKMTTEKLDNVKKAGANAIIDVCPFCHLQYDVGQAQLKRPDFPVLHLSQLYGLAFGIDKAKLGLEAHQVPVKL